MRRLAWLILLVVAAGALVVGTRDREPLTAAERVEHVAATIRCPACRGESVRDSPALSAQQAHTEIERRVRAGESDDEIRDAFVASYGESILLNPPRSGAAAIVWALPVAAFVCAAAGLAFTFRRWRTSAP